LWGGGIYSPAYYGAYGPWGGGYAPPGYYGVPPGSAPPSQAPGQGPPSQGPPGPPPIPPGCGCNAGTTAPARGGTGGGRRAGGREVAAGTDDVRRLRTR